ncbi:MAG TPA: TonB-dependent receptor, partial [Vicinamibacterales bacterium]|nr:TonB-dependent receptor [Vicinamibacterales bacterium]
VPNQLTMYGVPTRGESLVKGEIGIYVQDRWTIDRWTINAGLRYDAFRGGYPEQYRGPVLYQPTRDFTFAAVTTMSMHDLTPRLGASYDLFGTGKTALKVSLGKYMLTLFTVGNPAGVSTTTQRNWNDLDRDFNPDCDLINPAANGECSAYLSPFGTLTSIAQFDEDTRFGWGNRPYNWEFSTSVQHELAPRLGIDVGYFRRWFGNFQVTQILGLNSADFDPYSVTAPVDSRLPDGGGYRIEGLYNLNPSKVGQGTAYTALARDFGDQTEQWNGMDFSANARLQNGLLLQGGVSTGRTVTDNCDVLSNSQGAVFGTGFNPVAAANPSLRACHVEAAFLTQAKFLATYTLPRVDVNVAATVQSTPGPVIAANRQYTNAEIIPSLGRPLSGGAANTTINLLEPGDIYGDRINQLDVRVGKIFRFGGRRASVNLDIYNMLNANPVMQENAAYAVWRTPQRIMDARLFKISGQFDF